MRTLCLAMAVGFLLAAGSAQAQTPAPPEGTPAPAPQSSPPPPPASPSPQEAERFVFHRVADVFIRLDKVSGQVSVCSRHDAGWACQAMPEDRAALESEIARLRDKIDTLQTEIAMLREPPPPRPPADLAPRGKDGGVTIIVPTQDDIDRARDAVAHAWRRIVDMLVSFKNELMKKG